MLSTDVAAWIGNEDFMFEMLQATIEFHSIHNLHDFSDQPIVKPTFYDKGF